MPIHPDDRHRYPAEWPRISKRIRHDRAGNRCECSGQCGHDHRRESTLAHLEPDDRCRARNREPHPVTGSHVVLTVAHLDHTPENVDDANLLALCQRCHLAYDRDHHAKSRSRRRAAGELERLTTSAPLVLAGDCREVLPTLPAGSVDAVVTSPPYLRQRAYGQDTAHELGLEETVAAYVSNLADVFDELRRVLRPTGHAWLNIGDKANNCGGAGGDWTSIVALQKLSGGPGKFRDPAYPDGSFVDVPGQVVAELLRRGWRLRSQIVWDKGRDAPESLRHIGRPRRSHEMIYLLSPMPQRRNPNAPRPKFYPSALTETGSVWHFPPGGNGDPHLAPFPDELARRCILPSTLPGDVVLDPFAGSGTVPRVANELGRRGVGIELYADRPELLHKTTTRKETTA
jgi:site-specific DNA-methyltransferase (adenine-specific)